MPSGLVGKTLSFGAVVVSAANALLSRSAQARAISKSSLCFIKRSVNEVNGADLKERVHSVNSCLCTCLPDLLRCGTGQGYEVPYVALNGLSYTDPLFYQRDCAARAGVVDRVVFGPLFVCFASTTSRALLKLSMTAW